MQPANLQLYSVNLGTRFPLNHLQKSREFQYRKILDRWLLLKQRRQQITCLLILDSMLAERRDKF